MRCAVESDHAAVKKLALLVLMYCVQLYVQRSCISGMSYTETFKYCLKVVYN